MNSTPAYSLRSLMHMYGKEVVLDIPQLEIPSNQILGLIGPNGCGKTSLLSILALLLNPSYGSIKIHGAELNNHGNKQQLRQKITLIHQKPVLFHTSVQKNIAYGLRAQGLHSKAIKTRVQAIMEETNLSALAGKHAQKLSGGEMQRVVLARGLILETPIVLLDEPTNSLDESFRPLLRQLLLKANQDRGATIIIAAHDINFVSSLTDQFIQLEKGKVINR